MPQAGKAHAPSRRVLFTLGDRPGEYSPYHRPLAQRLTVAGRVPQFLPASANFGTQLAELLCVLDALADGDAGVGLVGSGAGAAVALAAAALRPQQVMTVIARGGEPERAEGLLREIRAPLLLITDGSDAARCSTTQNYLQALRCAYLAERLRGPIDQFTDARQLRKAVQLGYNWLQSYMTMSNRERAAQCA